MTNIATRLLAGAASLGIAAALVFGTAGVAAETSVRAPAPTMSVPNSAASETAIFAGGCFWGVQGVFQHVKGVKSAVSGFTGGAGENAYYDRVSAGDTGHAEAIRVTRKSLVVS